LRQGAELAVGVANLGVPDPGGAAAVAGAGLDFGVALDDRADEADAYRLAHRRHSIAGDGERYGTPEGKVRASFEIVYLTGWAPDASQQQPLKPGSAKRRLADALGTTEHPAGDKAAKPAR